MINYELTELQTCVTRATEAHKAGKSFTAATSLTPPGVMYISQLLNGSTMMNMIICLSQAPQNGWETWFSLQYGTALSKLAVGIPKQKQVTMKTALTDAKKVYEDMKKKADPKLPATKHTKTHQDNFKVAEFKLAILEALAQ